MDLLTGIKLTEKDLQKLIMEYLQYQRGNFWRVNSGSVFSEYKGKKRMIAFVRDIHGMPFTGFSDIVGIWYDQKKDISKFVAIEVKVKPNKPTRAQESFISAINYWGGIGIIAYSLEDVTTIIT